MRAISFRLPFALMLSAALVKTTTLGASSNPPPSPNSRPSCDGWLPKPRHDRRPRVKAHCLRTYQPAHPVKLSKMAQKRAQQRWSGLFRRIAEHVLQRRLRKCLSRADSSLHGACPHNFCVDVTCARAYTTLCELHLDHEQDVVVTCDMWVQAHRSRARPPRGTTAWTARCCATCSSR